MLEVEFSSSFKRAFRRRITKHPVRVERFWRAVEIFKANPRDPSLRLHKLTGKLGDLLSFSVEQDLRVVFFFSKENTLASSI